MGPDRKKLPRRYRNVIAQRKRADVLLRIAATSLPRYRKLGLAGTCVIVFGGVFAGVPPMRDPVLQLHFLQQLRTLTTPAVMCVFVGLSMPMLAWGRVGRLGGEGSL